MKNFRSCYLNSFQLNDELDNTELIKQKYNIAYDLNSTADFALMLIAILPAVTKKTFTDILFYPGYSYSNITRILVKLVRDKKITSFGEGKTRWYRITKYGLDYVKSNLEILMEDEPYYDSLFAGIRKDNKLDNYESYRYYLENVSLNSSSSNTYPFHKEVVAKLISLLLVSAHSFYFNTESSIDDNILKSYLPSLKTDLFFGINKLNRVFSVEVDTGSETINVLTEKLFRYSQSEHVYNKQNPAFHQIIFVFEKKVENTYRPSATELSNVWDKVINSAVKEIDQDELDKFNLTRKELKVLRYVVKTAKLVQVFNSSNNVLNEPVNTLSFKDSTDNLEEYFTYTVDSKQYKAVMYGAVQYNFFKKRMLSLAHRYCLYSQLNNEELLRSDFYFLMSGLNVLACCSTMFLETCEFDYDSVNALAGLIGTYIDSSSYPERLETVTTDNMLEHDIFKTITYIRFDRTFYFDCDSEEGAGFDRDDDIITFCEEISCNISGYVRMYCAIKDVKTDINCTFLCIVNSYQDAIEFVNFLDEDILINRDLDNFSLYGTLLIFSLVNELDDNKIFRVKNEDTIEYFNL